MKFTLKSLLYPLSLLIPLVFILQGCSKFDEFGNASLEFDAEYAVPLFTADISIDDILGEVDSLTSFELDEDGLVHLIYRGDFTQRSSTDIFASIPLIPVTVSDTFYSFPYDPPNDIVLNHVIMKEGTIAYTCQSTLMEDVMVEIELPEVTDPITGETYKENTVLTYTGGANTTATGVMDLTGWKLTPDNGNINIRYTAIDQSGNRIYLNNVFMLFQNFKASYLEGYLGQEIYDLPRDTIFVNFFDRWIGGGIVFENPVIHMDVENSFGLPVRSLANILDVWTLDGSILPIQGDPIADGLDFAYPSLEEVGESKFSNFVLDKNNSNIIDVFSQKPIALDYDFDALGNPDGDQNIIGFATDSSFFSVHVFIDLPVHGTANMFTVLTDIEIDADLEEDYEHADYAILKFLSDNKIPMDLGLQLYFKDIDGFLIDSLFDVPLSQILPEKKFIDAAGIDANGYSVSPTTNNLEIEVPREKFNAFKQTKILGLVTVFDNETDEVIRLTNTDKVSIKVGIKAGISPE